MDTQTRYDTLRHQGFQDSAIAAIIGVEWSDLEAHIVDPENVPAPAPPGGGGGAPAHLYFGLQAAAAADVDEYLAITGKTADSVAAVVAFGGHDSVELPPGVWIWALDFTMPEGGVDDVTWTLALRADLSDSPSQLSGLVPTPGTPGIAGAGALTIPSPDPDHISVHLTTTGQSAGVAALGNLHCVGWPS